MPTTDSSDFGALKIGAQRTYARNGIDIYIWRNGNIQQDRVQSAAPIQFEEIDTSVSTDPAATIRIEEAQRLIDDLWNAGLRPTHARATDETVAAQKAHIADLKDTVVRLTKLLRGKKMP